MIVKAQNFKIIFSRKPAPSTQSIKTSSAIYLYDAIKVQYYFSTQ